MNRRRRLSTQQTQENVSRKQFEEFLEGYHWVTRDISPDLGEDILIQIFDNDGVSTGLSLFVQLKSVDDVGKWLLESGDISYPFEVKDLEHWEAQAVSVILAIWDVQRRYGWWIWINHAIKYLTENNPGWRSNEIANVHIPIGNEFNADGLGRIRHLLADLYYPIVSKGKGLAIQAKFIFPQTPEGKAKLNELERHFAAGDQVELDGQYIETFQLSDWWTRLYGEMKPAILILGPSKQGIMRPAQIEFLSEVGEERIPYVELTNVKQGQQEITFSNDHQNIPEKITLVLNRATGQNQIGIRVDFSNLDGFSARRILRINRILSVGGTIRLTLLETGEASNIPVTAGNFSVPDQRWVDFIEKVCFIQESLGIKIIFPEDGSFVRKDVEAADELVSVIQKGYYQQSNMSFSIELYKLGIVKLLKGYTEGQPLFFRLESEESFVDILSQRIELGPMKQKIRGYWKMPIKDAMTWLQQAKYDDLLTVQLVNVEMFEEFENWPKK